MPNLFAVGDPALSLSLSLSLCYSMGSMPVGIQEVFQSGQTK